MSRSGRNLNRFRNYGLDFDTCTQGNLMIYFLNEYYLFINVGMACILHAFVFGDLLRTCLEGGGLDQKQDS